MIRNTYFVILLVLFVAVATGCSYQEANPVSPDTDRSAQLTIKMKRVYITSYQVNGSGQATRPHRGPINITIDQDEATPHFSDITLKRGIAYGGILTPFRVNHYSTQGVDYYFGSGRQVLQHGNHEVEVNYSLNLIVHGGDTVTGGGMKLTLENNGNDCNGDSIPQCGTYCFEDFSSTR